MSTCSIELQIDKLPKIISKVEYFVFRAAEQNGVSFLELSKSKAVLQKLLNDVKNDVIPRYIEKYKKDAKYFKEVEIDEEQAERYENFAANLSNLLVLWKPIVANFIKSNSITNIRSKFKLDDNGLVDMSDVADDSEDKMFQKMTFDQPANEIDPIDEIDKSVELFLKSIPLEDEFDEYGLTVSVDYANLVKQLLYDLENTTSFSEIVQRLEEKIDKLPAYEYILNRLRDKEDLNKEELQFRINFANSFSKALIPINLVSIEDNNKVIKVFDAVSGKRGKYVSLIQSNFMLSGLPVVKDGKVINLAKYKNNNWYLDKDSIEKITDYLEKGPDSELADRQISFLRGLGFKLSLETEEKLKQLKIVGKGKNNFYYISKFLESVLQNKDVVTNPIKSLMEDLKVYDPIQKTTVVLEPNKIGSQLTNIDTIINIELATDQTFVVERSMINAKGDRVHSLQLHNNFTVLNKYFSDPVLYPTLQSIIEKEPSMFWLDPAKNPAIKNSLFLNSLFFLDIEGQPRRRVTSKGEYSQTEGQFVNIRINNTGGLQLKKDEYDKEGANSTSLNEIDKLLQDINSFFEKTYTSVLRLGDKSTDLGIGLNYYYDPLNPSKPVKHHKYGNRPMPLGSIQPITNIFSHELFIENIFNTAKDSIVVKYLANKGLLSNFEMFSKNAKSTWGYFDGIFKGAFRDRLDEIINDKSTTIETLEALFENPVFKDSLKKQVEVYFKGYSEEFIKKFNKARKELGIYDSNLIKSYDFNAAVNTYLANAFLIDLEQMKLFFGDALFFKDFHKRASKDSATGVFTFIDDVYIKHLNKFDDRSGYGANTNLAGRLLAERVYQQKLAELEGMTISKEEKDTLKKQYKDQRDKALLKQSVQKSYRSAVLTDVNFESLNKNKILNSLKTLKELPAKLRKLFDFDNPSQKPLSKVISDKYNGTEADGQGKCTFDFYRVMSILTSQWSGEQEEVYKKIVMFNHYDELAEQAVNPQERSKYIKLRDAVGYDPTEQVFFPPKKFQYSGPQNNSQIIDGQEYSMYVPIFDKFSLQPLIPTVIKGTADEHLAKKMEYNGVGYVKFESGSKVERPSDKDDYYYNFDPKKPDVRFIKAFTPEDTFKSEQELYFNHFKEQVSIDSEIHDHVIFGSQIRKLIMMNLEKTPEFRGLYNQYKNYIDELVQLEKSYLYDKMGIQRSGDRLKVNDLTKLVQFFFDEISKKNQDSNVRKALKYDEATGKFEIPLDAAVQAQVIEGIIISAINNSVVRYKMNGSMLTQMAITGSEKVKFNKDASKKALETFGNQELNYFEVGKIGDNIVVTNMEVKVALTGQWLSLLNQTHPEDGRKIETLPRLNEAIRNEKFREQYKKSLTLVGYRIPTQGRNFLDSMIIKEFLPASVGDAIIMPSEVVIKSGSDFDIDKMFVFYPSLDRNGKYIEADYTKDELLTFTDRETYEKLKGAVQNKLITVMSDVILHASNFAELVTPSENYHIMPLIEDIFVRLGVSVKGGKRKKTDFKNTEILDRGKNIDKFISLLKGKSDLGIAAIANTFNVLFQNSNAKASSQFLSNNRLKTFFKSDNITKDGNNLITGIDFSEIYDEDGILKSEFFSEFINAFVDVAKDDYVFAVNVVTELSPVIFYMKYAGISSQKIFAFINQPAIREYISNLTTYQNKFLKFALGDTSARSKALKTTILKLGFNKTDRYEIDAFLGGLDFSSHFTSEKLLSSVKNKNVNIATDLDPQEKRVQIAMLLEMLNLKEQSDSMSNVQRALQFDTKSYSSSFDVYARKSLYTKLRQTGGSILSTETIDYIKQKSIIAPLDVSADIAYLLNDLFPVRNDISLNKRLLEVGLNLQSTYGIKSVITTEDVEKFARTAKNDYINFILQNFFDKSQAGVEFFKKEFKTDKSINEYLKELIETNKLTSTFEKIKSNKELYALLKSDFPFVENLIIQRGERNPSLISFKFVENGSNPIEKESVIKQFQDVIDLKSEDSQEIVQFFKDLSLYSIFQSGLNTSDISYTNIAPISLVNKLYSFAIEEYKNSVKEGDKEKLFNEFMSQFYINNPSYQNGAINALTNDVPKRGKWYNNTVSLKWAPKVNVSKQKTTEVKQEFQAEIPQNKVAGVESSGSIVEASPKVVEKLGKHAHSIDMIINGLRTRTTRSAKEMEKYAIKVGDIIKHKGKSADDTVKEVLARVTAVHLQGSVGWKGTWEKEGWRAEDVDVIDRFSPGAAAIEFELIQPTEAIVIGENISSKGSEFAKKLTNPGNNLTVEYKGKTFRNAEHAYQTWKSGTFDEAAYNSKAFKPIGSKTANRNTNYQTMVDILVAKLQQHPELIQGINKRGGLNYIQSSTHNVTGDVFWESKGQNKFIEALAQAYQKVQPTQAVSEQPVSLVKPGVEELFNSTPELTSVGTPEQYSAYIDSIFPDSKVKDVVYHTTKGKLQGDNFRKSVRGSWGEGIYFGTSDVADSFKSEENDIKNLAILNLKNPEIVKTEKDYYDLIDKYGVESSINRYLWMNKFDGAIREEYRTGKEYFVLEPNQIHILGNKQDIEGFKKFIAGKKQTVSNPLTEAGVKPTDMYGNAGKDIQMASESTQFIGFKSGDAKVSSTDKYRQAWGDRANTGNYTSNDVIMVSGSGTFRGVTADQIRKTLTEKYKPLLEKAVAAGASFRVGNQYAKGNLSDELIAKYLQQKGYKEEKLNGYSRWTLPLVKPTSGITKEQAIEEYGDDLIYGVNLRSKQDKIRQGDEETILEAYNYLKAEEKAKSVREQNKKEKEELKTKIDNLKKRIDGANQTKVGDVVSIYNDESVSQFKAKVKAIEFKEKTAIVTVVTAKNKEYTYVVDKDGISTKGTTEIENFVFESSGENKQELVEEYNKLVKRYNSIKEYVDAGDYWVDYSKTSSEQTSEEIKPEDQTTIQNFKESLGVDLTMSNEDMLGMYKKEQLSGETLEDFLKRAFCNGKLK